MANRRQLVRRRQSVRNIRKITRTMQLIATARFQKALARATATRPYAQTLSQMVDAASRNLDDLEHPLLEANEGERVAQMVITSNRGLCGGYNGNILRTAMAETRERRDKGQTVDLHVAGKKGVSYFRFLGEPLASQTTEIDDRPRFEQVAALADTMMESYRRKEIARVQVCYMRFVSTGLQRPEILQLLPIAAGPAEENGESEEGQQIGSAVEPVPPDVVFDFSPEPREILKELLPATVRMRLFQCFTDAAASEQVARMVAMKAATDAAGDMIRALTQQYNRARQTAITMELLDIVGGAAALS